MIQMSSLWIFSGYNFYMKTMFRVNYIGFPGVIIGSLNQEYHGCIALTIYALLYVDGPKSHRSYTLIVLALWLC